MTKLWYGRRRRLLRAVAYRVMNNGIRCIPFGPLRGFYSTEQQLACRLGIYELHIQFAILSVLDRGDVFYDIGANSGYFSLLGAETVGRYGHVYAFEPLPENTQLIEQLMATNRIEQYTIIPMAVSNIVGTLELFLEELDETATPSLVEGDRKYSIPVRTTTLDEIAANSRWPKLIKLDVEGAETLVLEGAKGLLSKDPAPKWIIEIHDDSNDLAVRNMLTSHNYEIEVLMPFHTERKTYPYHIIASKSRGGTSPHSQERDHGQL